MRAAAAGVAPVPPAVGGTAGPSSVTRSVSTTSGKPTVARDTAPTSVPVPERRFARSTTSCTVRVSRAASGRSQGCPSSDTAVSHGVWTVATNDAATSEGFTIERRTGFPSRSMSAAVSLQTTLAFAGAAESMQSTETASVVSPAVSTTDACTGRASTET